MHIDEYLDMLTEDYFEFKKDLLIESMEWDILDEDEKSEGIFARIKSMVDSIVNWFKTTWENFVNRFKEIPIVKRASMRISSLINKIRRLFGRTNKNNAAETYEEIKNTTEEARDEANKAAEEVKRRRAGTANTSDNAGKMHFKDKSVDGSESGTSSEKPGVEGNRRRKGNADTSGNSGKLEFNAPKRIDFGRSFARFDFEDDEFAGDFIVRCYHKSGGINDTAVLENLKYSQIKKGEFEGFCKMVAYRMESCGIDKTDARKFLNLVKTKFAAGKTAFMAECERRKELRRQNRGR